MAVPLDRARVCPSIFIWHRYAAEVKADLFSTAIVAQTGTFFVDPIPLDRAALLAGVPPERVRGVVVTNENHGRAAADFARESAAPLYAHPATAAALELPATAELSDGREFAPGLTAITIDGAPAGEIAIYSEQDGGSLIIGDALINMGSYGFALLPPKYCANQKRMRKSLRKLLDYEFQRILFAHGLPIASQAKSRLADLLESSA